MEAAWGTAVHKERVADMGARHRREVMSGNMAAPAGHRAQAAAGDRAARTEYSTPMASSGDTVVPAGHRASAAAGDRAVAGGY